MMTREYRGARTEDMKYERDPGPEPAAGLYPRRPVRVSGPCKQQPLHNEDYLNGRGVGGEGDSTAPSVVCQCKRRPPSPPAPLPPPILFLQVRLVGGRGEQKRVAPESMLEPEEPISCPWLS